MDSKASKGSKDMVPGRVMVVTEDPGWRSILVSLLKDWRYEVFPAADGVDALRQIYQVSPQAIVSDTELGSCAGFELLPFLRRRFPEIGVVLLVREEVGKEFLHRFLADYIVSMAPLHPALLADSLIGICDKYPFRQEDEGDDQGSSASGGPYDAKVQLAR